MVTSCYPVVPHLRIVKGIAGITCATVFIIAVTFFALLYQTIHPISGGYIVLVYTDKLMCPHQIPFGAAGRLKGNLKFPEAPASDPYICYPPQIF